ncbi:MAG: LamG domain-containing protein [Methanomicrobiales archaeon]
MKNDHAINEIIGSFLIVILVIAVAAIVASLFLGLIDLTPKSAFIAPDITSQNISGKNVVKLYNRGGDTASLNLSSQGQYVMGVYIDSSTGSTRAVPLSQTNQFRPGDTLYVFKTASGFYITNNLSELLSPAIGQFPPGAITVRLVDENSHLLIAKWNIDAGGSQTSPGGIPNGTSGFWSFNDGAGTTTADLSGKGYTGIITNATWVNGKQGKALLFNGIDSSVRIQGSASEAPENAIAFEAWVNPTEQNTTKIIQKRDWDGEGIGQDKYNGWQGSIYTADKVLHKVNWGGGPVLLNSWTHLALTYDGASLKLYVNGVLKGETPVTGKLKKTSEDIYIGSDAGGQKFFKGTIDEAAFYNRSLSAAEIASRV